MQQLRLQCEKFKGINNKLSKLWVVEVEGLGKTFSFEGMRCRSFEAGVNINFTQEFTIGLNLFVF